MSSLQGASQQRLTRIHTCRRAIGKPVKDIGKGGKADLLRTLSKKLERRRLHTGWIERILHARVPILKFTCKGKLRM